MTEARKQALVKNSQGLHVFKKKKKEKNLKTMTREREREIARVSGGGMCFGKVNMEHEGTLSQMGSDSGMPSAGHFELFPAHWSLCHCALPRNIINWVIDLAPCCSRVQLA